MRVTSPPVNGVRAKAYPGCTGVILAFNLEPARRKGLLGFAIERRVVAGAHGAASPAAPPAPTWKWLQGALEFPGLPHIPGQLADTNQAPVQKFRWSDYAVYPGVTYEYRVHPCYGDAGALDVRPGPSLVVKTLAAQGDQVVTFNRAVGASQAWERRFPKTAIDLWKAKHKVGTLKDVTLPPEALDWLARDLLKTILAFLGEAGAGDALDIAIYEYELDCIRKAVADAAGRGVTIRLLYHGPGGSDPEQARVNAANARKPALPKGRVTLIPRDPANLMHDKFVVLSALANGVRTPRAVLCGSTNFTTNGVYMQANVVHVTRDAAIARDYLAQFERMVATAQDAPGTRREITAGNPMDAGARAFAGFSPRSDASDLQRFVDVVTGARRDVLFTTVFEQVSSQVLAALIGKPHDPILRIGLQNSPTGITGIHKDRTASITSTALLDEGIEGWLKEHKVPGHKGNIFVHTKMIVVDFTGDAPTVISGSHNFTRPASHDNDENYLILRARPGETEVADAYGVELMRLYDHYRFRWVAKHGRGPAKGGKAPRLQAPPTLDVTDAWTKDYFGGDPMRTRDREYFCP